MYFIRLKAKQADTSRKKWLLQTPADLFCMENSPYDYRANE